ncbi:LapA family protein [Tardiphaga sp.]|uniref:LapA family protein n=1 Tax=Tardiphaga sp. TaxID=1926292 RepID=UPI0026048207|nr:LapA family protein [Tardiphaga sp.]MDB5619799.1 hypothetical protein [Tardiphaga sp.]
MRKFFSALILTPVAIVFIVFAVANRHFVMVSFDPFNSANPSVGVSMPLFVVIILAAIFGVMAGGLATWLRQGHWRRAARLHEADARHARTELADFRVQVASASRQAPQRLPSPAPASLGYGASERDKTGATL